MRTSHVTTVFTWLTLLTVALLGCTTRSPGASVPDTEPTAEPSDAVVGDLSEMEDMFQKLLGKSEAEVQARLDAAWEHFFYGDENTERIYYPVDSPADEEMAYVIDINNNDIRSEGISYGMMIAVQMNKQAEFDRIWRWAKTYMYQEGGQYGGYFSWHNNLDGTPIDVNPASDGEIWITTALFFAAHRWGNGEASSTTRPKPTKFCIPCCTSGRTIQSPRPSLTWITNWSSLCPPVDA